MVDLYLTNTRTHKKEKFVPNDPKRVGIYSCGPTVYWNQHIGHMYAYVQWDVFVRFLKYIGYDVKWVMNITDVGHMTGENLGDADSGEDKMEKGARREKLTVWQVADKYIKQFMDSLELLNIQKPNVLPRATEHIDEQIDLIKEIEKNGFTYKTKTGLVFDTSKFKGYTDFARLDLQKQRAGARVDVDPEKKQPEDFLLWVTNKPDHIMQWDSPWERGFPGWHIECTAMSVKYLGENFDIHTGGKEHIPVHHTNEVAQGYGAFKKHTANYWLHNDWLTLKDEKMSKSKGNLITVQDLVAKGYDPMHLRYLVLSSQYKKGLVFSWESLEAAKTAYNKMVGLVSAWREETRSSLSKEKLGKIEDMRKQFTEKLANDLNLPEALAVVWEAAKSNIPNADKLDLVLSFDQVLGLCLDQALEKRAVISEKVSALVQKRQELRKAGKYKESDKIRDKIRKLGYTIKDTSEGSLIERK
jgi:cysteinyl-tRNA synthetase